MLKPGRAGSPLGGALPCSLLKEREKSRVSVVTLALLNTRLVGIFFIAGTSTLSGASPAGGPQQPQTGRGCVQGTEVGGRLTPKCARLGLAAERRCRGKEPGQRASTYLQQQNG
jgi:hypothetical protein